MTDDPVMTPEPEAPVVEEVDGEAEGLQLTRSEVINEFGEELGRKLIDANIASFSDLRTIPITDEEFGEMGLTPEEIIKIRQFGEVQTDGVEAETASEPEVDEAAPAAAETIAVEEGEVGEVAGEEPVEAPEGDGGPKEPAVEEAAVVVAEMADAHVHDAPAPLTYSEALAKLEEKSYSEIKELLEADGIKAPRSKAEAVTLLLQAWFPPAPAAPAGEPEMSVRVRRAMESL